MKVKMMVTSNDADKEYDFVDLYIEESNIKGFYIPEEADLEEQVVNVLYPCLKMITVKTEKHVIKYLTDRFV